MALLAEELKERPSACGLLIIVMSKRYPKSDWCKDELEWFG